MNYQYNTVSQHHMEAKQRQKLLKQEQRQSVSTRTTCDYIKIFCVVHDYVEKESLSKGNWNAKIGGNHKFIRDN